MLDTLRIEDRYCARHQLCHRRDCCIRWHDDAVILFEFLEEHEVRVRYQRAAREEQERPLALPTYYVAPLSTCNLNLLIGMCTAKVLQTTTQVESYISTL